ncbi:hypothetical protein LINPERHAP1_LOCUS4211, partial [Linum perenne]
QSNLSISEYFTQLKALWDELANFRSIPACECAPICICVLAPIRAYHHSDFVIRFLRGLSESFSAAPVNVMLMDPLPSVNRAFSMMLQQERQLNSTLLPVPHTENMAFVSRTAGNLAPRPSAGFKNKGKRPVCSYCNYVGHTAEVCYKKNGYPPGYKPRPRLQTQIQPQAHCVAAFSSDQSQTVTPVVSDAPITLSRSDWAQFQQQYNRMAQMVQQPQAQVVHKSQASMPQRPPSPYTSPNVHDDVAVDLAQTVRVNSVVSDQPGPSGNQPLVLACVKSSFLWVLDTGATDHIVCDKALFSSYNSVDGISVQLPDGSKINAICQGTVHYSPSLTLHNVLLVPGFNFNLISISQLAKHQALTITFNQHVCLMMCEIQLTTFKVVFHEGSLKSYYSHGSWTVYSFKRSFSLKRKSKT